MNLHRARGHYDATTQSNIHAQWISLTIREGSFKYNVRSIDYVQLTLGKLFFGTGWISSNIYITYHLNCLSELTHRATSSTMSVDRTFSKTSCIFELFLYVYVFPVKSVESFCLLIQSLADCMKTALWLMSSSSFKVRQCVSIIG